MKQFTQYLYECQQEKRIRNVGFVKAELKPSSGTLRIQARGMDVKSDGDITVYLFYKKNAGYESVFQGMIPKRSPMISYTLEFGMEDIGNANTPEDIAGFLLLDAAGKCYMAVWNGEAVNLDDIHEIRDEEEKKEIPEPEGHVQIAEENPLPEMTGKEEQGDFCEKIQRKDLARLPRKDWRLANNNFLLHGFYNYHHLLWIEEGKELYIGVPGVCHSREIQAAKAFGFTQFRQAAELEMTLGDEEQDASEDFGYFCRRILRNE